MKIISSFLFVLFLVVFSSGQSSKINIIPKPGAVALGKGAFTLSRETKIVVSEKSGRHVAGILNEILFQNVGFKLAITSKEQRKNAITFVPEVPDGINLFPREGYHLNIDENSIRISGREPGMFYAIQSLVQLLPHRINKSIDLSAVDILDQPRFPYRGMHLDVARHFMPVEFVKKYIDLMSQYKFNYFHWHLTEDQGWRIEIKKYPRLTEIGSKRSETVKERNLTPYIGDGIPVEGFYTQEQIKDVVAYAKAQYITVIPEIELPGHASAALAAYPQFGCKADYKYEVKKTWGIFKEVYCPTEETFKFLEDVLDETIKLFPDSPYIHIGGDEVLKDHWKESAFVQELMKRENLKDEHEVQSYFVRRIEKFINSKGKKMIGWDEILEGGLAPNATVMSWRGTKGGIEAAKAKHDVIMTPTDSVYFDYAPGDPASEPLNIGGYVPLSKVYLFDPVPKELLADEAKYIIGGQANVWTEYMKTPDKVEYMAFPRMLALAEVLWSSGRKDYQEFQRRLAAHLPRLDAQKVNYRIPEPIGIGNVAIDSDESTELEVEPPVAGAKVYYTTDGSTPTESSPVMPRTLDIDPNGGRVDIKTLVVLASGRKSAVYTATVLARDMLPAVELTEKRPGATFAFVVPASGTITSGETKSTALQQFGKTADLKQPFGVSFDGYLNVPVNAMYEFQSESTWDAGLSIDGEKLIDDAGTADRKIRSSLVVLKAGLHKISVRYNHRGGEPYWRVRWAIKGQNWRNLGGGELVH